MMDEDELDPRIQVELEKLNSATDIINKLEIELDEANTTFRMLLNECTRRLKVHSSKHGSAIENARPYYEALDVARRAQQDCQQAAVSFQRANEVHEAAKETVALAESRFMSQQPEWRFDSAWQEMLNHATIKVRDAEKQRAESSAHHGRATAHYKGAQDKVQLLEQRLRRNVAKSRPYFEEKQRCNEQLAAQKEAVETLAAKVARVKAEYAASLRRLEGISEEIHRKRGNIQMGGCGVREPGVGAELEYIGEQGNCDAPREDTSLDKKTGHGRDSAKPNDLPDTVGNTTAIRGETVKGAGANVRNDEGRISFDSLHARHFNPAVDRHDICSLGEHDSESENELVTDVSLDLLPEFVFPPSEASSSNRCGLPANRISYGDIVSIERTTDKDCNMGDVERAGDRLATIALHANDDGNSSGDVIEVVGGGDAGGSKIKAPEERSDTDSSRAVDSISGCDDNLLGRRPDLELTFQPGKTMHEDNDRDAALESPGNTREESQNSEVLTEQLGHVPN